MEALEGGLEAPGSFLEAIEGVLEQLGGALEAKMSQDSATIAPREKNAACTKRENVYMCVYKYVNNYKNKILIY